MKPIFIIFLGSILVFSLPSLLAQSIENGNQQKEKSVSSISKEGISKEESVPSETLPASQETNSKEESVPSSMPETLPASPEETLEGASLEEIGPVAEELYVLAETYTHVTPFVGPRLTLVSGEVAFASQFGGARGTHLDLNDDFFISEDQLGTFFGIDVQHSYFRISLSYGFNWSESKGNIKREVVIANTPLQRGAKVSADIDTHWFNGNLGYTFLARDWGGIGIRLNFSYLYIRLTAKVDGIRADDPANTPVSINLVNSLFIPTPTVGSYFDIALHDRVMLRSEVDFIFYDIARRRLTTVTFGIESRYYFVATQEYYGYFKFQYEYFHYNFETSQVDGQYDWHSFIFLFGAGIKF